MPCYRSVRAPVSVHANPSAAEKFRATAKFSNAGNAQFEFEGAR
jgi:hypothetical protein